MIVFSVDHKGMTVAALDFAEKPCQPDRPTWRHCVLKSGDSFRKGDCVTFHLNPEDAIGRLRKTISLTSSTQNAITPLARDMIIAQAEAVFRPFIRCVICDTPFSRELGIPCHEDCLGHAAEVLSADT